VLSDVEEELQSELSRLRSSLNRERRARGHRLAINRLAAVTSGQVTRRGVAEIIANGASEIFDAGWVMVGFVGDDDTAHFVHGPDVPEAIKRDWQSVPLDVAVPMCDVLRGELAGCELHSRRDFGPWPILLAEADRARLSSFAAEPVPGSGRPSAVIGLGWEREHRMDEGERDLLAELAEVAEPAFRRATTTEADQQVASTLQRWLLPTVLPDIEGLALSTIYAPGKHELQVGGDWYDAVLVDDGRAAIVVGDVVGHDVRAAAEMGQIRHVLSSNLARSGDAAESLALTDRYFHARGTDTMATALVMIYSRASCELEIASAGHLPPVIVEPGTVARTLDCGLGPPLGSGLGGYTAIIRPFPPNAVVIGYTDGVVERRDADIDRCVTELCSSVDGVMSTNTDAEIVAALTDLVRHRIEESGQSDDAAAVVIQSRS
jgi:serine phosphatase RsbU (regulator of sigma subunit)